MRMDKSILSEYADMKEEIKDLRRRIVEDQKKIDQLKQTVVSDSVSCGKKGKKPIRTVKIKGFPRMEINHRIALMEKRKAKLQMLETDLIAEDMKDWKDIVIKADCAEPKAIRYYKQSGFRMKACKKFKGSRAMYTKKVKRFKKIVCSDACPNTIDELQDLTFAVDKDDEIIEDEFNIDPHTLSAIWYALDDYEVSDLKGGGLRTLGTR